MTTFVKVLNSDKTPWILYHTKLSLDNIFLNPLKRFDLRISFWYWRYMQKSSLFFMSLWNFSSPFVGFFLVVVVLFGVCLFGFLPQMHKIKMTVAMQFFQSDTLKNKPSRSFFAHLKVKAIWIIYTYTNNITVVRYFCSSLFCWSLGFQFIWYPNIAH